MRGAVSVGSLFSGIGGLDLGLERAGMTVVWQSEIDPYCCELLKRRYPDVPNLGDVTLIDWEEVPRVDLICGGYPCQPFSTAGAKASTDDERHLWPYMRDAIRVLRPGYALMENVAGHLARGFGEVLADLAALGYDAEWDCIPARAVGAPIGREGRDRVFIVAHTDSGRLGWSRLPRRSSRELVGSLAGDGRAETRLPSAASDHWAVEPDVGRVAHGVPHRVDRLRGLGNAVVPQVAEWIGRRIMAAA